MLILEYFYKINWILNTCHHKYTLHIAYSLIRINTSFTYTASEFSNGCCESGIQILSKMLGQNFRTEFPTTKAGEKFISA